MHTPLTVQASWNGGNAFKSRTPHMHAKRPGSAARKYQMYDIFPYSAKKSLWFTCSRMIWQILPLLLKVRAWTPRIQEKHCARQKTTTLFKCLNAVRTFSLGSSKDPNSLVEAGTAHNLEDADMNQKQHHLPFFFSVHTSSKQCAE